MGKVFILRDLDGFTSISQSLEAKNIHSINKTIEQGIVEANYYLSKQLQVPLATKLFYLKKMRIVENEPRSIETTYISYDTMKGLENFDFNGRSFYEIISEYLDIKTIKAEEEIMIVEANEKECELLNLPLNEEIMLIKGLTYLEDSQPFEYFEIVAESSFYRFRGGMHR